MTPAVGIPANAKQLAVLVEEGEGPALEFKRSTGELKEGMRTLCAFLNGSGGMVLFDDRIEIRSYGRLPNGITVKQLSGRHDSKPTNPLIAGAFHRTGAVEVWGRGTNRVIAMCKQHGAPPPVFEERQGFLIVTFKAQLVAEGAAEAPGVKAGQSQDQTTEQVTVQVGGQVTGQVAEQVLRFCQTPRKASEIRELLHLKHRETFTDNYLRPLLEKGWLEPTIPSKPRSRMQRYRTTVAGLAASKEPERES
jgi:predicted HTH transcriptional regulator